jgi:hypothetical protein
LDFYVYPTNRSKTATSDVLPSFHDAVHGICTRHAEHLLEIVLHHSAASLVGGCKVSLVDFTGDKASILTQTLLQQAFQKNNMKSI